MYKRLLIRGSTYAPSVRYESRYISIIIIIVVINVVYYMVRDDIVIRDIQKGRAK